MSPFCSTRVEKASPSLVGRRQRRLVPLLELEKRCVLSLLLEWKGGHGLDPS